MMRFISAVAVATVIGIALPAHAQDVRSMVSSVADEYGVPRHVAHAIVAVESRYNCRAYNRSSGARGIMQVLPATARGVGVRGNLLDCHTGLVAGMRYLRMVLARGGDGCAGVSLYERGLYARPRCTGYGRMVMRAMRSNAAFLD